MFNPLRDPSGLPLDPLGPLSDEVWYEAGQCYDACTDPLCPHIHGLDGYKTSLTEGNIYRTFREAEQAYIEARWLLEQEKEL